ncbi:MAG: hypothetical protein U0525_00815 [Patescibacteria group bacterium]
MTRKTKADKIASKLRALKHESAGVSSAKNINQNSTAVVFHKEDAVKTFATTLLILALIGLIYILQIKGYIA